METTPGGSHQAGTVDPARVIALIPCYREAATIGEIVTRLRARLPRVIVIDDGSGDATAACAREAGAEVIAHPRNLGKGAALKTGFRTLLQDGEASYDYVLLLDGDGQHRPEELEHFLAAAAEPTTEPTALYLGNRMERTESMPLLRRWTNQTVSRLISQLCGQPLPDTQCGFRLIHRRLLPALFCPGNAFDYETEMLLVTARAGHRIVSVPISTIYAGETSRIRPLLDGLRFLRLLARERRVRWEQA